jgi:hypothetical protein
MRVVRVVTLFSVISVIRALQVIGVIMISRVTVIRIVTPFFDSCGKSDFPQCDFPPTTLINLTLYPSLTLRPDSDSGGRAHRRAGGMRQRLCYHH